MNDNIKNLFITRQVTKQIGDAEIVLETIGFQARHPAGGLVWNRPAAVIVRGAAGEQRLPIHDLTRRRQVVLYGLSFLFVVAGLLARGRPPKE